MALNPLDPFFKVKLLDGIVSDLIDSGSSSSGYSYSEYEPKADKHVKQLKPLSMFHKIKARSNPIIASYDYDAEIGKAIEYYGGHRLESLDKYRRCDYTDYNVYAYSLVIRVWESGLVDVYSRYHTLLEPQHLELPDENGNKTRMYMSLFHRCDILYREGIFTGLDNIIETIDARHIPHRPVHLHRVNFSRRIDCFFDGCLENCIIDELYCCGHNYPITYDYTKGTPLPKYER
jgi:hypothetical protein